MLATVSSMARQIAQAAVENERDRTGHGPESVSVMLGCNTLVITLHGALSPAEKALAGTPEGVARLQEYHRQLFLNSSEFMRREIGRITGVDVCGAAVEVESEPLGAVQALTSGTMVQVFLLNGNVPTEAWNGNETSARAAI